MKLIKNIAKTMLVMAAFLGMVVVSTKSAKAVELNYVPGVIAGNTVTYTNTSDIEKSGFIPYYPAKINNLKFVATPNTISFGYNIHTSYTKVRRGFQMVWMYVFDGYNLFLNVPAHQTVVVTAMPR